MNELEKTLSRILEKSLEVAEQTGEFVMEQAPQLLQEFYMWHITKHLIFITIGFFILILGKAIANLFGREKPYKWIKDKGYSFEKELDAVNIRGRYYATEYSEFAIAPLVVRYVSYVTFGIIFFVNIYDIIFIAVAPKLYLIEYFIK